MICEKNILLKFLKAGSAFFKKDGNPIPSDQKLGKTWARTSLLDIIKKIL